MPASFPPLMDHDKWGATHPKSTLNMHRKSMSTRGRPLDEGTLVELRATCGPHFKLLCETVVPMVSEAQQGTSGTSADHLQSTINRQDGKHIYGQVWGSKAVKPDFNPFDFTRRNGFAPRPKELPPPGISSLSAWFSEYGHPKMESRPGVRTEFEPSPKSVPRSQGEQSAQARMIRGTVLR
eukprot:scaffold181012_cov40-Tisochrysis_lutea.AAC.1